MAAAGVRNDRKEGDERENGGPDGGDSDIVRGLERYYREHPGVAAEMGIDQEMYHYIRSTWSTKRDLDADPESG